MRFLHCADIHLDSPLLGLEDFASAAADEFRLATRRAFERVVELAIGRQVGFVLIAGDLYDSRLRGYEAPLFFVRQMKRLEAAGIPVALIHGNHDSLIERNPALTLPDNVNVFGAKRPESRQIVEGVWVHGQSFARRWIEHNLARDYPEAKPDAINIGLLHTSLTGIAGHEAYAPCSEADLLNKDYDYWALGHVHQRQTVCESPWIGYPGNPQGRHFRETGEKGCLIADVEPTTRAVSTQFHPTATALWTALAVDAANTPTIETVLERIEAALGPELARAAGRPMALRVSLDGVCEADGQLRDRERLHHEVQALVENSGEPIWLERVVVRTTSPLDREALARQDSPLGAIVRLAREMQQSGAPLENGLADIAQGLEALRLKLPAEIKKAQQDPEPLRLDAAQLAEWLPEVESDLLARLARLEGDNEVGR